jgi:hypothetical protein
MTMRPPLVEYIINHKQTLLQTDFCRELWMVPERLIAESKTDTSNGSEFTIHTNCPMYKGRLFVYGNQFYGADSFTRTDARDLDHKSYRVIGIPVGIKYDPTEDRPICTPQDVIELRPGDIANYKSDKPTDSTIGIFVANYLFLVYPFNDTFDYINGIFSISKLENIIGPAILDGRVTTTQVKDKYVNTLSLFGQSNDMICPNISEKNISIPPEIHTLRDRLVEENKEALERGDASVMTQIEKQLIAEYRKHLEGDSSMHFLLKKKYFDVTLKKLFLTHGMVEIFGSPGKFRFVAQPLSKGWKQDDLPTIFNEVRQGSYSRAVETANGGVIAKLILRVFQDTRIGIKDCGTTNGEHIHGDRQAIESFVDSYVVAPDKTTTLITNENVSDYSDRDIVVRTPGYCEAPDGFCAKCFGRTFEVLGQEAFAPVANDVGRNQVTLSLKKMHGVSHNTVDVSQLNKYLVK